MALPKTIIYRHTLKASRDDDSLTWELPIETISTLFLQFPWEEILKSYYKRAKFSYGFGISGYGDDIFPIVDAKIELSRPSLKQPEFTLEVAAIPDKLSSEQLELLISAIELMIEDDKFKVWWDHDPRGPRKRNIKAKRELLDDIKKIDPYSGVDDLKLEDVDTSISEALAYFGFASHSSRNDVRKTFKLKYREYQLKYHPDSETGSEQDFLFLQKCHRILTKWIR